MVQIAHGMGEHIGRYVETIEALVAALALATTFALGVKAPLDDSVFAASAGAFLLAAPIAEGP